MVTPHFYGPKDIMSIMQVSRSTANRIMHIFEERGELFRVGRIIRVRANDFDRWASEVVGTNNKEVNEHRIQLETAELLSTYKEIAI